MGQSESARGSLIHAAASKSLVIVALPRSGDPVNTYSSEKQAHLTLAYLGENNFTTEEMNEIVSYVAHASTLLEPFILDVRMRGVLGDEKADVLFFNEKWSDRLAKFRNNLLAHHLISKAYLSTDQFPQWTPHLTMGYPDKPAKPSDDAYNRFTYVDFDRIALWTGDSDGPTFQLTDEGEEYPAVAHIDIGRASVESTLAHYGVKGMRWGVTRTDAQLGTSKKQQEVSEDFRNAANNKARIKAGGTKALSNKDLQAVITRENLERQYTQIASQNKGLLDRGNTQTKRILGLGKTYNEVQAFMQTPGGKVVKNAFKAAATVGFAYATGGAGPAAAAGAGVAVRRMNNHYTNTGN